MTPLTAAMQELGLTGEVGRRGRWIRIDGEQGSFYVIEAAWGGGYHAFSEASPGSNVETYRDPVTAIQAWLGMCAASTTLQASHETVADEFHALQ